MICVMGEGGIPDSYLRCPGQKRTRRIQVFTLKIVAAVVTSKLDI